MRFAENRNLVERTILVSAIVKSWIAVQMRDPIVMLVRADLLVCFTFVRYRANPSMRA